MKRIVFATGNENKMKEIRMILKDLGMEILSMKEAGADVEIVEDGMSFEENAEIKARAVARVLTNDIVLADDSGLEIDYLDKAPGIYSARLRGRIPLMISRTGYSWTVSKECRRKSVLRVLYARWQQYFRTGQYPWCERR